NGGGKITPWNDQYYVGAGTGIYRLNADFLLDNTFLMYTDPLHNLLQGGDYHVYPDGRVLMNGVHVLHDTVRGYLGLHCLCWFSNTGYLDTTAHHRTCYGSLDFFTELPNGQFIGSGSTSVWDGQPASNIIRFNADGALDTTFQAHVWWGQAYGFLPLPNGRVYAGGNFMIEGIADTLNLVRFLSDGSLDPTFNNHLDFQIVEMTNFPYGPLVRSITAIGQDRLIVSGNIEQVEGHLRRGICLVDTSGNLVDDYFTGPGCGNFAYQGDTASGISGITTAPDGSYYIWGAYHGYDDGTTNDPGQRMVSRLYGLDVGIHEQAANRLHPLVIAPNPSAGSALLSVEKPLGPGMLTVHDASGRVVLSEGWPAGTYTHTLRAGALAPGTYLLHVQEEQGALYSGKLILLP
ncbi:MAG: T9SS type A sorting domain-containing protein, partial [Flavobacteriales bacterium]|nr:T9SS type A sorting domain-containing protein [Flavobacteriales bacterium]